MSHVTFFITTKKENEVQRKVGKGISVGEYFFHCSRNQYGFDWKEGDFFFKKEDLNFLYNTVGTYYIVQIVLKNGEGEDDYFSEIERLLKSKKYQNVIIGDQIKIGEIYCYNGGK